MSLEFEIDDNYKVEHGEGFVLDEDQLRKLIESKFQRNNALHLLCKEQERKLNHT